MSASLMTSRRFAPLFWCQAFSAFGDNFLKTALVFLILFRIGGADSEALITLAGATLIFPFFILSGLGGELADRYDKALVARRLKLAEIAVAALAVAGFATHSIVLLFMAVGLYGTIASLFGPIKYGILPDHLARSELPSGNALVEGGTFLAILLGTIVAGLAAKDGGDPIHFAWLMMVSSVACWVASRFIPPTGESAPNLVIRRNIFASTGALIKYIRGDKRLWWGALVTSWFWLTGALVMSLLPPMVSFHIGGSESVGTVFLTIFSVAVAIGSALAAWLDSRPLYPFAAAGRRRSFRVVLDRSRLDQFGHGAGRAPAQRRRILRGALQHSHRHRSRRPRAVRRLVHRTGIFRGAGLGGRRSPRPCRRRHQRAQCRVHGRRRDRACGAAKARPSRF